VSEVAQPTPSTDATVTVERGAIDALLAAIARQGYQVGSTVHEGAVVDGDVRSSPDLPGGWSDEQDGGTYRLRRRDDEALTVWLRKLDLDAVDLVRVDRTFNAGALAFKRESERHDRPA
jgi:hypothetical protein